MTDVLPLLRLMQTTDSAFPSGAFAFSSGLETLRNEGKVRGAGDVHAILTRQILPRWLGFERPFLKQAMEAADDTDRLLEIDARCHVQNSSDRLAEASRRIGRSLLAVHGRIGTPHVSEFSAAIAQAGRGTAAGYEPVVQGVVAAGLGLSPLQAQAGTLNAAAMAFVSAAVRLGCIGAIEAQSLLAQVAPDMARGLAEPCPDRAGSFSPLSEIAAVRRNTTHASLFAT
ncbi:MAG: urease accessory protein UreF [Rhodobacteraceae bacterium]|jgi:urease accessory protein|nr:urease accessory protein UreF [Paracoccaceae bacterium]